MGKLFKVVGFLAPVMVVLFIYVAHQHAQIDAEMDLERVKFERSWAEFDQSFFDDTEEGEIKALARAMQRAEDANAEIQKLTEQRDQQRDQIAKMMDEFEATMNDENFDHSVLDELEARMSEMEEADPQAEAGR